VTYKEFGEAKESPSPTMPSW